MELFWIFIIGFTVISGYFLIKRFLAKKGSIVNTTIREINIKQIKKTIKELNIRKRELFP